MDELARLAQRRFLPASAQQAAGNLLAQIGQELIHDAVTLIDKLSLWVVPVPVAHQGRCRLCDTKKGTFALELRTAQLKVNVLSVCEMCLSALTKE